MWLVLLIIATIAVVLFLIGFLMRRRQFAYIDDLEIRKIDLMSRPVLEEVSRVKDLNLDGETEESFAGWRKRWDVMLSISFPEVELLFFEAEENADTFRFGKVKHLGAMITTRLDEIEKSVDQIFSEIDTLMKTASKNEERLEGLKERFKELKKYIIVYNHSFGKSLPAMERAIGKCLEQFPTVDTKLTTGDYFSASVLLDDLDSKHDSLIEKSILIPKLYEECNKKLPETLTILMQTFHDMKNEGYPLHNLDFEKRHAQMEQSISESLEILATAEASQAQEIIQEVQASINVICEQLETEEKSKAYILEQRHHVDDNMKLLVERIKIISEDTTKILAAYRLQTEDLLTKKKLEEDIVVLHEQWTVLRKGFLERTKPFSEIKISLVEVEQAIAEYLVIQKRYSDSLLALSEDEIYARTTIVDLREIVKEVSFSIKFANLPGVPESFTENLADVKIAVANVDQKLEDVPLDMKAITALLNEAKVKVDALKFQSDKMISDAAMVERVILYGNRHRLKRPAIANALNEAEIHFKQCKYTEALGIATQAIEQVESGFYDKLEEVHPDAAQQDEKENELDEEVNSDENKHADAKRVETETETETEIDIEIEVNADDNQPPHEVEVPIIQQEKKPAKVIPVIGKPVVVQEEPELKKTDSEPEQIDMKKEVKEAVQTDIEAVSPIEESKQLPDDRKTTVQKSKRSFMSFFGKVRERLSFFGADEEDEDDYLEGLAESLEQKRENLALKAKLAKATGSAAAMESEKTDVEPEKTETNHSDSLQMKVDNNGVQPAPSRAESKRRNRSGGKKSGKRIHDDSDALQVAFEEIDESVRSNTDKVTTGADTEQPMNVSRSRRGNNPAKAKKVSQADIDTSVQIGRPSNTLGSVADKNTPISSDGDADIDELLAEADATLGKIFEENKAYTTFSSVNEINDFYDAEETKALDREDVKQEKK